MPDILQMYYIQPTMQVAGNDILQGRTQRLDRLKAVLKVKQAGIPTLL